MKQSVPKRILSLMLTFALMVSTLSAAVAAEEPTGMTRGQTRDALLAAADDYNPGITAEDILQGYPNGDLRENETVTLAEALVMLSRAFGELPAAVGDNARWAVLADPSAAPQWAMEELAGVLSSGIVTAEEAALLSSAQPITEAQLTLLIQRVYALMGTNLKTTSTPPSIRTGWTIPSSNPVTPPTAPSPRSPTTPISR